MPPALPFPMVAHFPVQISKLPLRLPAPNRRSTNDLTFQPAHPAKSCRFRSYENLTPFCRNRSSNPFRIRSYRKCARKSFRMRSYKNTGGGGCLRTSAPPFASAVTCATWRLYPLWPQSIAHTSRHHGGVPLRELVRCTEAPKCLSVSPLFATLTHSVSRKSFPCHSYANTQDGGDTLDPVSDS